MSLDDLLHNFARSKRLWMTFDDVKQLRTWQPLSDSAVDNMLRLFSIYGHCIYEPRSRLVFSDPAWLIRHLCAFLQLVHERPSADRSVNFSLNKGQLDGSFLIRAWPCVKREESEVLLKVVEAIHLATPSVSHSGSMEHTVGSEPTAATNSNTGAYFVSLLLPFKELPVDSNSEGQESSQGNDVPNLPGESDSQKQERIAAAAKALKDKQIWASLMNKNIYLVPEGTPTIYISFTVKDISLGTSCTITPLELFKQGYLPPTLFPRLLNAVYGYVFEQSSVLNPYKQQLYQTSALFEFEDKHDDESFEGQSYLHLAVIPHMRCIRLSMLSSKTSIHWSQIRKLVSDVMNTSFRGLKCVPFAPVCSKTLTPLVEPNIPPEGMTDAIIAVNSDKGVKHTRHEFLGPDLTEDTCTIM